MAMENNSFNVKVGDKEIGVEINGLAEQASGSCFIKCGGTSLLCVAQIGKQKEDMGFFPLTCDYVEKYYAAGKIGGSRYMRREGRPSTEAVLVSRMIDRAVRPLFPKGLKAEVQIIATCLSWDEENDPVLLGFIGSSIALLVSEIPWQEPIGAVRIGKIDGKLVINPSHEQREKSEFDLIFAGVEKNGKVLINMIEGELQETDEQEIIEAFDFCLPYIKTIIEFQKEIRKKAGKEKTISVVSEIDLSFKAEAGKFLSGKLEKAMFQKDKRNREQELETLLDGLINCLGEEKSEQAKVIFEEQQEKILKENILKNEKRVDNRKIDEVRNVQAQAGFLPRTHGSGLFSRGLTKVLSILTLGAPGDQLLLEGMIISGEQRFMHHYNFPPYSVGEVKRLMSPGRREIGHGMLAEKSLRFLLPSFDDFPYTIRIVSEVLSSNGSSSMGSLSAASIALMDAGVPIKRPATGVAMGLVVAIKGGEEDLSNFKLLTDIQGPEDHYGDMDFKAAGTEKGVTALQMDVKIKGITKEIFSNALKGAKKARIEILATIKKAIESPRQELSPFAPRVFMLKVNPEKIGQIIGPGGKMIKQITEECSAEVDIEDDGRVFITSDSKEGAKKAIDWVNAIAKDVEVGEVYKNGKVTRLMAFGAFVEFLPGKEGLCHISQFSDKRVEKVEDVVKIGDVIPVKVVEVDEQGRINLSAKQAGFKVKQ